MAYLPHVRVVADHALPIQLQSVAGPLVWNSIAYCLRDPAIELASFKRQLKTFLFARY